MSTITNYNIWASTVIKDFSLLPNNSCTSLSNIFGVSVPQLYSLRFYKNSYTNLNFFDGSRFWLLKKFYYLHLLKNNFFQQTLDLSFKSLSFPYSISTNLYKKYFNINWISHFIYSQTYFLDFGFNLHFYFNKPMCYHRNFLVPDYNKPRVLLQNDKTNDFFIEFSLYNFLSFSDIDFLQFFTTSFFLKKGFYGYFSEL